MEPWIKLYKKFTDWEWYNDNNVKVVFLHLLLTAHWRAKKWQGLVIQPGELVTSYQNLANDLGMSVQCVRNALKKLVKSNAVIKKSTNRFTLIKLVNYCNYQAAPEEYEQTDNTQKTNGRQTADKQSATTKEIKKYINKEGNIYPPPKRKNSFQDYDDEITDFDIKILKNRLTENKED